MKEIKQRKKFEKCTVDNEIGQHAKNLLIKKNWNQKNFWKKLNTSKCFLYSFRKFFMKMTFWFNLVAHKLVSESHNTIILTPSHILPLNLSKILTLVFLRIPLKRVKKSFLLVFYWN